jgi:hypothetical protein
VAARLNQRWSMDPLSDKLQVGGWALLPACQSVPPTQIRALTLNLILSHLLF